MSPRIQAFFDPAIFTVSCLVSDPVTREARDKTLDMPGLILPSIQVNMRAGNWSAPEANGTVYLKLPVNAL